MLRYFIEVAERWPVAWSNERGYMLAKTNGFNAFMVFLRNYLQRRGPSVENITREEFRTLMSTIPLLDADFNTEKFRPGSSGQADLVRALDQTLDQLSL